MLHNFGLSLPSPLLEYLQSWHHHYIQGVDTALAPLSLHCLRFISLKNCYDEGTALPKGRLKEKEERRKGGRREEGGGEEGRRGGEESERLFYGQGSLSTSFPKY